MSATNLEFIAAGGNRHPSAADWHKDVLAFGSGNNIAIWNPQHPNSKGITALLAGHTDAVNAIKIFQDTKTDNLLLISGSADNTVRLWTSDSPGTAGFSLVKTLTSHTGSVNAIAVLPESGLFLTGAADATVKVWRFQPAQTSEVRPLSQTIRSAS